MKYKNTISRLLKGITAIILLVTLASCGDDFLSVSPEDAVTPDNFFQEESDFRQAVDGAYAPLQDMYDSQSVWAMGEMRSDNTHYFFNPDFRFPPPEQIADFLVGSENEINEQKYNYNYDVIARSNQVLAEIDNADFEQASKDDLKGQALFLRALAYFDLVRYYGAVPLHLEPATSLETASLSRSPESDVYEQVIADATAAADLLPGKADQEPGRATSGAAYTLLGDVYLTLEQWENAENALSNVNDYSLLDDYADIFDPSNKNNEESIFEVQYMEGTSLGLESYFPYYFIPLTEDHAQLTMGPSGSQSSPQSGWNIPTEDLLNAYEDTNNDERYDASIGFITGPSLISDTSYVNLPYIKKYQHPHSTFGETNQNFPVYRYAEVLLMMAEAINEQGGRLSEAEGYLNQVRNRAGLNDYNAGSQSDLREAILRERRIELAFENKRWLDLVRTGNAVEVMNEYGESIKGDPNYFYLSSNAYNVDENDLLFPIPFSEIQVNPDLEQNPGY
ncbi:RagB/SusD family nutrient uptake outer membrane protein [Halalkalibaculum sp. DA3122]|uniref:RagB/SusD family nutrient uptake outer membrane protein n=1 Tax=Halalkalibaculum sp. DA3122 TaxID=3373607 RepID=UPI0037553574